MSARAVTPAPIGPQPLMVPGRGILQRSLLIGSTDDPQEREAERRATEIVGSPSVSAATAAPGQPTLRRACAKCEEEERTLRRSAAHTSPAIAPPSVAATLAQPGEPLAHRVRNFMEPRFAADFSRVRVHRGDDASRSAAAVNARAYTVGEHVVFGAGQYAPETANGQKLLAHELTHVIQQAHGPADANGRPLRRQTLGEEVRSAVFSAVEFVDPESAQFASDLVASVQESPSHVLEFFTDELWDAIREHWPEILTVTIVLLGAEAGIAALGAAPTGVSQIVAAILEIIVLAILFATVAVETVSAVEQGIRWWNAARDAHGDPGRISDASREFVRMCWHILMLILAVVGVRGRFSSGAAARIRAPLSPEPAPATPPALTVVQGGAPGRVAVVEGRVVSTRPGTGVGSRGVPVASARGGALPATMPEPEVAPVAPEPPPLRLVPPEPSTPAAGLSPAATAATGLSGATGTAGATAQALATRPRESDERDCGPLPITWPGELPLPEEMGIVLTRTNAGTREWEGIDDRGPAQQALARQIREARSLPLLEMDQDEPPFRVCGNDVFEPGVDYDAHHIHPLFLGGGDYDENLCALSHPTHVAGHRRLNDQNAWIDTYRQCGINSGTLTRHPQMTEYFIADEA